MLLGFLYFPINEFFSKVCENIHLFQEEVLLYLKLYFILLGH